MKDLFKALYDHFHSDPMSGTGKFTEIYNTIADVDAIFPYLIFSLPDVVPDNTFTERSEDCLIQFDIYSDKASPVEVCELFELLKGETEGVTGFDYVDLSVDNHVTISFTRSGASLNKWEVGGKMVWNYSVSYSILLEKV